MPAPMTSDSASRGWIDAASSRSGSERNQSPRAGEQRLEELEAGLGLVVQARHEDRAVGRDLAARERRPEQVRREHERPVRVRLVEQVVEQLGHAELVVHPPLLLAQPQRRAGDDRGVERGALGAGRGDHGREAAHRDAVAPSVPRAGTRWPR